MKTILFITLPYRSHYYPAFSIAQKYRNEGYRVIFTCTEYSREVISEESFESLNINYLSEYVLSNFKQFLGLFIKHLLDKRYAKQRVKEFYYTQMHLRRVIDKLNPERIFLETNISEYYLFFKDLKIETELISIFLSTEKKSNIPPPNSDFIPTNSFASKLITEILWGKYFLLRRLSQFFLKVALWGKDDYFFQKRLCQKKDWIWDDILSKKYFHSNVCKKLTNNILASSSLEFKTFIPGSNEVFIGTIRKRNENKFLTEEYLNTKDYLLNFKESGGNIIYLAFGTLAPVNDSDIVGFIKRVINIVENNSSYRLIYNFSNPIVSDSTKHCFRFNFLPQLDILKYTDIMITHGGLSSIKECYDAKIPMLIVPVNKEIDQPGNAARVEANGFGKRTFLGINQIKLETMLNDLIKKRDNRENYYVYN